MRRGRVSCHGDKSSQHRRVLTGGSRLLMAPLVNSDDGVTSNSEMLMVFRPRGPRMKRNVNMFGEKLLIVMIVVSNSMKLN